MREITNKESIMRRTKKENHLRINKRIEPVNDYAQKRKREKETMVLREMGILWNQGNLNFILFHYLNKKIFLRHWKMTVQFTIIKKKQSNNGFLI